MPSSACKTTTVACTRSAYNGHSSIAGTCQALSAGSRYDGIIHHGGRQVPVWFLTLFTKHPSQVELSTYITWVYTAQVQATTTVFTRGRRSHQASFPCASTFPFCPSHQQQNPPCHRTRCEWSQEQNPIANFGSQIRTHPSLHLPFLPCPAFPLPLTYCT